MNSKVTFKLNSKGVRELLKSPQMQSILRERVRAIAGKAGEGYYSEVRSYKNRAVGRAYPGTSKARHDNYENNTLLKAL